MERSLGEDELEREMNEFDFGQNQQNPVYNNAAKRCPMKLKHVYKIAAR